MSKSVRRFYTELKPSHYELQLTPDAKSMTFYGTVDIRLKKTGRPSQRLTFHQNGLKFENARIIKHDKKGSQELTVQRINNHDTLNEVRIHTAEMVYAGDYEVHVNFKGKITRDMTGLYPCFFKSNDEEQVLLATQFESHYARDVFPCIDEPEAKATFHLTLITPPGLQLLSNTPIEKQATLPDSMMSTSFETTPLMSTYLLAFVIGNMHSKSTKTKRGTNVGVWATATQPLGALDFALGVAKRSIEFFEDYFGVPYPLAKIDHVALPDFSAGAMENWGLVTYRERALLAYPNKTSQSVRELIATVIAHETSHQWFGNLVTMRWWDDLWLNESFADLMEYQAVDALFPEWQIWESFSISEGLSALRRDALFGVQAVKTNVRHPDEISTLFDSSIVYAKGGRLLFMLKTYIGEEAFRRGLTDYFTSHAYGNTTGNDLWQALGKSSSQDIAGFMNPWLDQAGFPVVSVDQTAESITISQAHFLENDEASDGRLWPVPLFTDQESLPDLLTKAELKARLSTGAKPVLLNQQTPGHYIVNYVQSTHHDYLIELLKTKSLGVIDRLMLLNSASMLAKAGHQPFGETLKLVAAYGDEASESVWAIIALLISEARRFIDLDEHLEKPIKTYVGSLVKNQSKRLGWDEQAGESSGDRKLRATILGLGAYAEEPAIINEATKRFADYQINPEGLNAELRSLVFGVPVKNKLKGAFQYLLKLHDETNNSDLKSDAMSALTMVKDPADATTLLSRLKDADIIKPQDAEYWLIFLLRNRYTRNIAWQWLVDSWPWIEETYARDKSYDDYPRYVATICNTQEWAEKYAQFFKPKQAEITLKRNIVIGLTEIDTRVKWLERDLESVRSFFSKTP
jgi:aminopeptidase N